MEDDPGAAEDERTIELSSIAAIYPELVLDPKNPYSALLDLPITPIKPLRIAFKPAADSAPPLLLTPPTSTEKGDDGKNSDPMLGLRNGAQTAVETDEHNLSHLPPLTLKITLPEGYPSEQPPNVILSSKSHWIPRPTLRELKSDCTRLWEEWGKDSVVYTYIDYLQQAAETAFGLVEQSGEKFHLSSNLKLSLLDFDLKTKKEIFEKETFDCGICLEPKKGVNCHRLLLCSHVFCVACLQDFYNNCIQEGDVENIKCLDPGCGKEDAKAVKANGRPSRKHRKQDRSLNPSELLQIPLKQETVQRYVRLKRKKKLESDKNTIYCPRQWCQGAARSKKYPKPVDPLNDADDLSSESDAEVEDQLTKSKETKPEDIPMSERLCVCEDCDYAFCSVCKKTWHGELSICNPRRQNELNEEEKASLAYLQSFTTPCPTCNAPSQKTMGCNHMICFKCNTHFCYLCSSYLMPDNPYRHFNDHRSLCYMRLWELEGGDGEDVDIGFAGRGAVIPLEEHSDDDSASSISDDDARLDIPTDSDDEFVGVGVEEDTDNEEPAPDQRRPDRPMQVEIIVGNQRIIHNIPQRPRVEPPPPPAPVPPQRRRRRRGGNQANHQRRQQQEPQRVINALRRVAPAPAPPVLQGVDDENPAPGPRAAPAPGQGNYAAQQPAPLRQMGLDRFLELAERDEEDEWDSDELDDDLDVEVFDQRVVGRERGWALR